LTRTSFPKPKTSIDFASYALTDQVIIQALTEADHHGVAIRIVLDPRERHDFVGLGDLADNVRIKHGGPYMQLKAYSIDGQVLRTGSANFSTSGEHQQDNDLVIIRDAGIAARFDAHFERMWDAAQPMRRGRFRRSSPPRRAHRGCRPRRP